MTVEMDPIKLQTYCFRVANLVEIIDVLVTAKKGKYPATNFTITVILKPVVVQRDSNCLFSSPYRRCSHRMFGATADRSRCLQNGEKSRCTFRTNVQCLDSFREYHANADSNTSKLFLFTPAPPHRATKHCREY